MKTSQSKKNGNPINEVIFDPKITTISVRRALEFVCRKIACKADYLNPVAMQLSLRGPVDADELICARVRAEFMDFCDGEGVTAKHVSDPTRCYQDDPTQDNEFEIAISEFALFAHFYGLVVRKIESEKWVEELVGKTDEVACNSQFAVVKVQRAHPSAKPDSAGINNSDDDQWDLEGQALSATGTMDPLEDRRIGSSS